MYRNDRRMFERVSTNLAAVIKEPSSEEGHPAQCADISASGVGLLTKQWLIPGQNIEVELTLPNKSSPFRGLAGVVWSKQVREERWRSGLKFWNIDFMALRKVFEAAAQKA